MKKCFSALLSLLMISSATFIVSSAFADPSPTCVSGTCTTTGNYDQICGVEDLGGGCYNGTNANTGQFEEVCGVTQQLDPDTSTNPFGEAE